MFLHARAAHRRPSKRKSILAATGVAVAVMTGEGLLAAAPAAAASGWDAVAQCESGGNASYNDGQFYGLYNFDRGTWQGLGYSGTADQSSAAVQSQAAEQLYAQRGAQPWPVCGKYLSGGSSAPAAASRNTTRAAALAAAPAAKSTAPATGSVVLSTRYVGSYRADVVTLQQKLVAKGYSIAVDGRFGPQTDGAVRAFQAAAHLEVDALVGPRTRAALSM
jgi:resuscitation-promoting factor RpfA